MGLDKKARAIQKALKEQRIREYRRKSKAWVRSYGGDTFQGYEDIWGYEDGVKFPAKPFKHRLPKDRDHEV